MANLFQFDKKRIAGTTPGIVGIDEAGRGCFAGPVVAGAVWTLRSFYENPTPVKRGKFINDSKQLSPETREEVFALVEHWERRDELFFAAGTASVREIDALNILGATRLAAQRAIENLLGKLPAGTPCPFATAGTDDAPLFCRERAFPLMLADGRPLSPFAWRHEALVKGDATSLAVALASIVAKVSRDRLMASLDAEFPGYGFRAHKGYGTPEHVAAILSRGVTPLHRRKFLRNLAASAPDGVPGLENLHAEEPDVPAQSEFPF